MPADLTYRLVIRLFRMVFRILGLRFVVRGTEHIPVTGAAVVASNHLSYLDFTFVGLAGSRAHRFIRFMAKRSVFDNPISGPVMRRMEHVPVDRFSGAAAYRIAVRRLEAGEVVGVFPEATISRSWTLKGFKLGAATLAVKQHVPLIPVVLWAPQRTFTVDRHYSVRRGKTIMVLVGAPLHPARDADPVAVDAQLRVEMDALLATAMRDYPDRPRDAADTWWVPLSHGGTGLSLGEAAVREAAARLRKTS